MAQDDKGTTSKAVSWGPALSALTAVAAIAVWFTGGWGGPIVVRYAVDLGCGIAAVIAGVVCRRAARTGPVAYRRSWTLLAWGTFAWALGELWWTIVDATMGTAVDNAAVANAAFLALPVLACAAVLWLPAAGGALTRSRWLFDGGVVAASASYVAWTSWSSTSAACTRAA